MIWAVLIVAAAVGIIILTRAYSNRAKPSAGFEIAVSKSLPSREMTEPRPQPPRKDVWRSSDRVIGVDSLDFVGSGASSPDAVYTIACGGCGDRTGGDYILLRNDEITLHGEIAGLRNEGIVSNNGTFILEQFTTAETHPTVLWAFDAKGNVLFKRRFNSGVLHWAASDDGAFCLAHSFPSEAARRELLILVDLSKGTTLFDRQVVYSRVQRYRIDCGLKIIRADCGELGSFGYDFTGNALDRDAYNSATENAYRASLKEVWRIEDANAIDLYRMGVTKREHFWNDPSGRKQAVEWLQKALDMGLDTVPQYKARACKILGEAFELDGEIDKAIAHYEAALRLNPDIGVKRRLEGLRG
jgi:hypothetical protein